MVASQDAGQAPVGSTAPVSTFIDRRCPFTDGLGMRCDRKTVVWDAGGRVACGFHSQELARRKP